MKKNFQKEHGQILLMSLVFLIFVLFFLIGLFSYTSSQIVFHKNDISKNQALSITEAGIEMAIWKLNNQPGYTGETDTTLGNGTFDVSISTIDANRKSITVTGYIPNSIKPLASRTVKTNVDIGVTTISFRYGVQVGNGGFTMLGGSTVNGNIYS